MDAVSISPEDALSIGDFGSVVCFYTDASEIDVDSPHKSEPLHRIAIPKILSTREDVRELEIGAEHVVEVVSGGKVQVVQVAHLDIVARSFVWSLLLCIRMFLTLCSSNPIVK